MAIARFQFNGIICEYEYNDKPSDDDIADRAGPLYFDAHKGFRSIEDAKPYARALIVSDNKKKADAAVFDLIKRAKAGYQKLLAEPGISQRLLDKFDIKDYDTDGIIKKVLGLDDGTSANPIQHDHIKPASVADMINNYLYELRVKREAGKADKGIDKDNKTVDLQIITPYEELSYGEQYHQMALMANGFGEANAQYAQEMATLNRFARSLSPVSRELVGFTFITRPRLNLSQANIANVRTFAPLLYAEDQSASLAIRFLLDTRLASKYSSKRSCELFDPEMPFLTPLCNRLEGISGFPDPQLAVETSEGGFFSEQQTNVIGYDRLAHGQDLQLQFSDLPGNPIMALHDYWTQYMGYVQDGTMAQYTDDIESNLMAYTVSIYRFITDATGRQITRWAKATGCFPKMTPMGNIFNVNQGEKVVTANREVTIPWWSHHVGYNDPIILKEFNMLVKRYNGWIGQHTDAVGRPIDLKYLRGNIINNRAGIPYITQEHGFTELVWLVRPERRSNDRSIVEKPVKGIDQLPSMKVARSSIEKSLKFPNN